jgi:O-antigen biosynthesis protein
MRMLRVRYELPARLPLVSVIVTGGRGASSLRRCISSLLTSTAYSRLEIILAGDGAIAASSQMSCAALLDQGIMQVLDGEGHDSRLTVVNQATAAAKGELLCFLDGDVEVVAPNWLGEMVSQAIRPEIGAVGACLRYPDGSIRHGGVILGLGGVSGLAHHGLPSGHYGYGGRAFLTQNYSAVTTACMVVRKEVFIEVGGLDASHFSGCLAGIDFCLKVRKSGYRNVWTPFAELGYRDSPHSNSVNAIDLPAQGSEEIAYMRDTYGEALCRDPAYNVNLDLTQRAFSLAYPPRDCDEEPA